MMLGQLSIRTEYHVVKMDAKDLLVCNWPHSVGQNHFIGMMLFNRDSAI